MADEVREERVDRLVGDPAALRGRDQGEADLGDATLLVDPDVDIADEFAVQLYRDLVMAAGRDVGEALVGSDQSPRPGLRVGQVPVLQRVDVGIISVCRERLDVLLPDEAQHQSIGPHREGTAGLDIAHRLRVLPKCSAGQPNFVTPARRPWPAMTTSCRRPAEMCMKCYICAHADHCFAGPAQPHCHRP